MPRAALAETIAVHDMESFLSDLPIISHSYRAPPLRSLVRSSFECSCQFIREPLAAAFIRSCSSKGSLSDHPGYAGAGVCNQGNLHCLFVRFL
jgi:hypothetical protein